MDTIASHYPDLHGFLQALAWAEAATRFPGWNDGLTDLRTLWERHVRDAEEHLFPSLVVASPAADRLVGFFLAEHADLTARLAALEGEPPTPDQAQAAIQLGLRLIQHILLEARVLSPEARGDIRASLDAIAGAA